MYYLVVIGIGGIIGTVLRYVVSDWFQSSFDIIPIGAFGVNLIGSF